MLCRQRDIGQLIAGELRLSPARFQPHPGASGFSKYYAEVHRAGPPLRLNVRAG